MTHRSHTNTDEARLQQARERQRQLVEQFESRHGRDEPQEGLRRSLALLWPSLVLVPLSLAAAASGMQGTTLAVAGGFVVWVLCFAIRERKRSKWFLVPLYLLMVLYMWIIYFMLAAASFDATNPFDQLLELMR